MADGLDQHVDSQRGAERNPECLGVIVGERLAHDACEARWWSLDALPHRLAFDHARLIKEAIGKLYGARP